jgi:hypothetical protein
VPAWCGYSHDHAEWAFVDRHHRSHDNDVMLTAMDALVDKVEGWPVYCPRTMSAGLSQHYREGEPRVCVSHGDERDAVAYLTIEEAERHARHLLELVRAARTGNALAGTESEAAA